LRVSFSFALCPSDQDRLTNAEGHTNYAGNAGSNPGSLYDYDKLGAFDGVFGWTGNPLTTQGKNKGKTTIGFQDIVDGLSQTAAFSEKVKGIGGNATNRDPLTPSSNISSLAKPANPDQLAPLAFYNSCKASSPKNAGATLQDNYPFGYYWFNGQPSHSRYTHVMTPNSWNCAWGGHWGEAGGAYTASSRHSGVVNVLMCDGSVRAIKGSIAKETWWALGSRDKGEVVSQDSY